MRLILNIESNSSVARRKINIFTRYGIVVDPFADTKEDRYQN